MTQDQIAGIGLGIFALNLSLWVIYARLGEILRALKEKR